MCRFFFLLLAAGLFSTPIYAGETYRIDPKHTNIVWLASHFGFSKSVGTFADVSGQFTLDEAEPENSSLQVEVRTDSIVTGIPKFDEHLKSDDFFNVAEYPTATYKSVMIQRTSDKTARIYGHLTMLGQTHPLQLSATLNKIAVMERTGKKTAGFSLRGTIDRTKYGMDYAAPGIPAEVELMIEAEGVIE